MDGLMDEQIDAWTILSLKILRVYGIYGIAKF